MQPSTSTTAGKSRLGQPQPQKRSVLARAFSLPQFVLNPMGARADKSKQRAEKKQELLTAIQPLKRGLAATDEQRGEVEALATALERINPNPKTLASPQVNGKWELLYTTSSSILGTSKPALFRPSGPIYQIIDAVNGKARNVETAPFFNQVSADLTPLSATKVKVQFKQFKLLGLIPITAPESAAGQLDITYVDDDLRVSRGDRGNLFVLRMVDRDAKP